MPDQLLRYHYYKDVVERLLFVCGLCPTAKPGLLYRLVPFVHCIACSLTLGVILNFCFHNFTNLDLFLKGLGTALGYSIVLQKAICMILYRKRLIKLHASLDSAFEEDLRNSKLRSILLSPLHIFSSPSYVLIVMTYMVHLMYWITPLVAIAVQFFWHVETIRYILPYPSVYPWKIGGWRYPAHYMFQLYAGFSHGAFSSAIDVLFAYYIFQICGQLRTLSHRMTNVKSYEDYRAVIRECVAKHQILTSCQDHLQRIYGPIVIGMLVVSAMIVCALIYQASHISPGKAALVLIYIAMKAMQTLFYGAFGSFLTAEVTLAEAKESNAETFRQAIYGSDWAGSGEKSLMTDILVMMTYKPLPMTACSMATISVDMFVAVCNTAFSYFFMLRTLEDSNGSYV